MPRATRASGPLDEGLGGYPYGARCLPPLPPRTQAFSSALLDGEVVASNWPNLVLLLREPLVLARGDEVDVESATDLRAQPHTYSFVLRVRRAQAPHAGAAGKRKREGAAAEGAWRQWGPRLVVDSLDGVFTPAPQA